MKNRNQFENEQEYDREDFSATGLTADRDNLLDDDLESEDTGAIDTDYSTPGDSYDELNDFHDDFLDENNNIDSATGDNMDDDPDFTGHDDA